jgi:hypothetical protein
VQQAKVLFLRDPNCEREAFSVYMPLFVEQRLFQRGTWLRSSEI